MKKYSKVKLNNIVWLFGGMLVVLGSTSCSVIKEKFGKNVDKEIVMPTDREVLQQKASPLSYTSSELTSGVVKGDWTIESVGGNLAVGEKTPFLRFVPGEKRIYGSDGCNVINGNYICNPADSTMSFSGLMSTMMVCATEGITDVAINQALADTRRYDWEIDGHDYRITLEDAAGTPLLTMVHCNFDFLNGAWHVVSIDGEPANVEAMNLVIDVDEGKIHGNTGCNILNGKVEADKDSPNSISFCAIRTTRMACPDLESETRLVVALEEAVTARALAKDRVALLAGGGRQVLELVKIDPLKISE